MLNLFQMTGQAPHSLLPFRRPGAACRGMQVGDSIAGDQDIAPDQGWEREQ